MRDLIAKLGTSKARASQLPWRDGDGYSWGGEAVLTIGARSVVIGAGKEALALAQEIERRWNLAYDDTPAPLKAKEAQDG